MKYLKMLSQILSYHLFMTFMRVKDPEFARRFNRIRKLHEADAPQWQIDREHAGMNTYMQAKYAHKSGK